MVFEVHADADFESDKKIKAQFFRLNLVDRSGDF